MQRSVLVVEDEPEIANLVKLHLKDLGCQVKLAFDGIVGFAETEAKNYDLIILDLMLPGMDGLELCRRLRSKSNYTPVLMLTKKSTELDRVLGPEEVWLTHGYSAELARFLVERGIAAREDRNAVHG